MSYTLDTIQYQEHFVWFGDANPKLNNLILFTDLALHAAPGLTRSGLHFAASKNYTSNDTATWFGLNGTEFSHSSLFVLADYWSELDNSLTQVSITACVIDAIWYETPVVYTDDLVSTGIATLGMKVWPKKNPRIKIDPEWAKSLVELYRGAMSSGNAFEGDLDQSLDDLAFISAQILALGIADSIDLSGMYGFQATFTPDHKEDTRKNESLLSSTQYDSIHRFFDDEKVFDHYDKVQVFSFGNWTDPASLTQYDVRSYETGYGYDTSTIPVQLSLAVLFIYVLVVATYATYSIASGRTATSWDSVGDLVVLALKSRPPEHMKGSSVGVGTMSTYRKRMNIRIHSKKNEAEMIFEDDPGFRKDEYKAIQPNEKY